jgi:hypothetical protein
MPRQAEGDFIMQSYKKNIILGKLEVFKQMKINMVLIVLVMFLAILVNINLLKAEESIHDYAGEKISYLISPLGRAEYQNFGVVDLKGIKVNLVTLKYKVLFVDSVEKIYSDPESLLPYKIERIISKLWWKDYVTEEYDQAKFTVVIKKFQGKKLVKEQVIKSSGPIQNVIPLLFYLRNNPDFKVGWNFTARILAEFKPEVVPIKLALVSIDQITIPAGKFQAYHFKSIPAKFEIWINKGTPEVPLKIKLKSVFDCSAVMKGHSVGNK